MRFARAVRFARADGNRSRRSARAASCGRASRPVAARAAAPCGGWETKGLRLAGRKAELIERLREADATEAAEAAEAEEARASDPVAAALADADADADAAATEEAGAGADADKAAGGEAA